MSDRSSALRREQLRILLAAVPLLIVTYFLTGIVGLLSDRRLVAMVVLLPIAAVVLALGLPLVRDRRLVLGGGFLWFFAAYCVLFSFAAGTRLLEGERTVVAGFEHETATNVLGLSRFGDWHYLAAPRPPTPNDLLVIALPSFAGRSVDEARLAEMQLIAMAVDQKAKGVALDYDLSDSSRLDRALCFRIRQAESASIPVVLGYIVDEANGVPVRRLPAPALAECVAVNRLGTLTGVRESDGRVRMVPTSHLGDTTLRSFSYRIASVIGGGRQIPAVGLAQFVAPKPMITQLSGMPDSNTARLMRDRFVIVGSERLGDVHSTPYGPLPGVMIHAVAVNSLRSDRVIRRIDVAWVLPAVFLLCFILIVLQAHGGLRPLLIGAAVISLAIVLSAALAMRARLIWIDVSYPLLAVGGLTLALAGGARLQRTRIKHGRARLPATSSLPPASLVAASPATRHFDVFLSHNSTDKPTVIELATALRDRKLEVWLDEWELVPGAPWQEAIEEVIETAPSAAVLVGGKGLGPWEVPEMRACLDMCVQRRMAVIPVLLPGVSSKPDLPLFLRRFTWVDLRGGLDEAMIDRLEWGITGIKPHRGSAPKRDGKV